MGRKPKVKVKEKTAISFEKDTGITRNSKARANIVEAETLIKGARKWLDEHKGEVCKKSFPDVCKVLGVQFSNAHNLSWEFSPSNPRGVFKHLTVKYKVYVGRHYGIDKDLNKQSVSFRELSVKDIPETDKETRKVLSG